jgi:hypothetical protein
MGACVYVNMDGHAHVQWKMSKSSKYKAKETNNQEIVLKKDQK